MLHDWFVAQLDYIFFWYGLAFLLLAVHGFRLARQAPATGIPWRWLGLFALLHGVNEWLELTSLEAIDCPAFGALRLILLLSSFLALVEFGRRSWGTKGGWAAVSLELLVGGWSIYLGWHDALLGAVVVRYGLGFVGAALSAGGIARHAWRGSAPRRWALFSMAVCLGLYGVAAGLVGPAASFWPASWLNQPAFFSLCGFPVQLLRAGCAVGCLLGSWFYCPSETVSQGVRGRYPRWVVPALLTGMILFGWLATDWRGQLVDAEVRQELLRHAVALARVIKPDRIASLSFAATDEANPAFQRLHEQLKAYGRFTGLRSLYTLALRHGSLCFGPENLEATDPLASPPGTVYQRPRPEFTALFRTGEATTLGPYEDEYGTFLSGLAPVFEPQTGKVLSVVGVDLLADQWTGRVTVARLGVILATMILTAILLLGVGLVGWQYRLPQGSHRWRWHTETVLTAAMGITATTIVTLMVLDARHRQSVEEFRRLADASSQAIHESLQGMRSDLEGVGRFLQHADAISQDDFQAFTEPLSRTSFVRVWSWIPVVPWDHRTAFETDARHQGEPAFQIFELGAQGQHVPAREREEYFPARYAVPQQENSEILGFDVGSETNRRTALEEARRTGYCTATGPLPLIHDPLGDKAVLAFRPLRKNAVSSEQGFAACALRPQAILSRVLDCSPQHDPFLHVQLVDVTVGRSPVVLAAWPSKPSEATTVALNDLVPAGLPSSVQPVFVFGRAWAIVAHPDPRFFAVAGNWGGPLTALIGLLLTAAVTALVGFLRDRQASLETQVWQRTQELRERENDLSVTLQSIGDAVIATDTAMRITRMNPMAERLTGWSLNEALGRPIQDVCRLLHAVTGEAVTSAVEETLRREAAVSFREERILLARGGNSCPVTDNAALIRDSDGTIRGAVKVFHDLTEEIRARQAIRESELRLETILQSIEVGIVVVDAVTHEIAEANRKALALIGAPREQVVGAICHRFICPAEKGACPITDLHQTVDAAERALVTALGEQIPVLKTVVPVQIRGRSYLIESFVEISDRKRAEESLRAMTERLQAVINTSPLAMVLLDAQGDVTSWNPAAERMLGWRESEVLGSPVPFSPQEGSQGSANGERLELEGVLRLGEECLCRRKDGRILDARLWTTPVFSEMGGVMGTFAILDDVTESKRAARELAGYAEALASANRTLEELNQAAESATRAKSAFLANMSHEIRTPMTAILGYADLLAGLVEQPRQKDAVATIKRNGEHLLAIINDILDLSKIESGKMAVERIDCSPAAILLDVIALMQVRADAKGLALKLHFANAIPETIQSDPTRLRQILVNLVGNALKFTEIGEVRIVARLVDGDSAAPRLICDVCDTGIGMSAEQQARLFQPFQQADATTSRKFGGTGLGLAISRRLAEMLDGEISVSSNPGEGSTFTLTVATGPLQNVARLSHPSQSVEPRNAATEAGKPSLRGRILFAEDGPENQRFISMILKQAGVEVTVVRNGQEALDCVLKDWRPGDVNTGLPFDLILMDMQMPVLNGFEATRRLREAGYPAPILALTAQVSFQDRQQCLDVGCNDFVAKPVGRAELLALVAHFLPKDQPAAQEHPAMPATNSPTSDTPARPAQILLAEDTPDIQLLIRALLEEAGAEVQAVDNGRLAVEQARARKGQGKPFDLVLMDMQMPVLDGYQAVAQLRQEGYAGYIVALTAHAMSGDRQKCLDIGCNDYLAKPVDPDLLTKVVAEAVAAGQVFPAVAPGPPGMTTPVEAEEILLSTYADRPVIARMLPEFVGRLEERLHAFEMALKNRELDELKRLAHQLKGAAGSYGYATLSAVCRTMEDAARQGDLELIQSTFLQTSYLCQAIIRGLGKAPAPLPTANLG